ncbi:MAG: uracil-DNA glycosylase [Bacteroidia bacterium]|jgi:uracil-DNA glycosylase
MFSAASRSVALEESWLAQLQDEFDKPYMRSLRQFLAQEKAAGKTIFPADSEFFSAFGRTPLHAVKVVILGQDPYHGEGQAHGLCFSVRPGVTVPPSLQNIYKEINAELGLPVPGHGHLNAWADQGVLLLNSVLSVRSGEAGSHRNQGWETFTDTAIDVINREREGVVFMLWGSYAQRKAAIIDEQRHCVLKAPHPSPLSAYRGFFGCGHFVEANAHLQHRGQSPVDWRLPERP